MCVLFLLCGAYHDWLLNLPLSRDLTEDLMRDSTCPCTGRHANMHADRDANRGRPRQICSLIQAACSGNSKLNNGKFCLQPLQAGLVTAELAEAGMILDKAETSAKRAETCILLYRLQKRRIEPE